jgi:acyl-CoA thioesterase FadM
VNLWFRLIWMLLTVWRRQRVAVLDTSVLRMTVLPGDLDFNGHVNNGRYFTMADLGRMDFVLRTGSAKVAWRLRARPIVADASAKFRRDLKLGQRFELHSRLLGWDEKWTFLEHRFVRQGRVLGVVVIRGLFVAPGGPVPPATFIHAMHIDSPSPALPAWVMQWRDSCDALAATLRMEEAANTASEQA